MKFGLGRVENIVGKGENVGGCMLELNCNFQLCTTH